VTPDWWEFVLLSLAAFRVFRLLAEDDILDRPRNWALGLPKNWEQGKPIPKRYRENLAFFIRCPWCAGFWISLLVYVAWIAAGPGEWESDELYMGGVSVFAISAIVGLVRRNLDPPEE
jgi:hypothetical protein